MIFVDNNTIRLIYNIFKNCKEYFLQMKDFDGYEVDFSLLLKKINSFKNKKQLLLQKAEVGTYKPKKMVEFVLEKVNSVSFLHLCLFAVITNCTTKVIVLNDDYFATNELIRSLINKVCNYYGFEEFITLEKTEKTINAICDENKILLVRAGKKSVRLKQEDFLEKDEN